MSKPRATKCPWVTWQFFHISDFWSAHRLCDPCKIIFFLMSWLQYELSRCRIIIVHFSSNHRLQLSYIVWVFGTTQEPQDIMVNQISSFFMESWHEISGNGHHMFTRSPYDLVVCHCNRLQVIVGFLAIATYIICNYIITVEKQDWIIHLLIKQYVWCIFVIPRRLQLQCSVCILRMDL